MVQVTCVKEFLAHNRRSVNRSWSHLHFFILCVFYGTKHNLIFKILLPSAVSEPLNITGPSTAGIMLSLALSLNNTPCLKAQEVKWNPTFSVWHWILERSPNPNSQTSNGAVFPHQRPDRVPVLQQNREREPGATFYFPGWTLYWKRVVCLWSPESLSNA